MSSVDDRLPPSWSAADAPTVLGRITAWRAGAEGERGRSGTDANVRSRRGGSEAACGNCRGEDVQQSCADVSHQVAERTTMHASTGTAPSRPPGTIVFHRLARRHVAAIAHRIRASQVERSSMRSAHPMHVPGPSARLWHRHPSKPLRLWVGGAAWLDPWQRNRGGAELGPGR